MDKHPELRVVAAIFNSAEDASRTASQLYDGEELRSARPLGTALIVREPDGRLHGPRRITSSDYSDVVDLIVESIVLDRLDSTAVFDPVELRAMAEGLAPETAMLVAVIRPEQEDALRAVLSHHEATIASTSLTAQMLEYALSRRGQRQESASAGTGYTRPPGGGPDVPPDDE